MKLHPAIRFLTFGLLLLVIPAALWSPSSAQIAVGISVRIGPPALPVYEQPLCPGPGYLWTPGYWAWSDDDGYYWVPGTWVVAPVGLLWTPGYWGWVGGAYVWNAGYWGPHVGFYGGINYGFGYGGVGFVGGEWRGGAFFYNTAVMHVDTVHITNVYVNRTVIVNNDSHVAFNGGEGGVMARPTPQEEAFAREPHQAAVAAQIQQEHAASQNRALFASNNHGAPAVAATARPGEFSGRGVVAARAGGEYRAPAMSPREARASAPAGGARDNNGFRPFTPPNRSNNANNNRPENNSNRAQDNRTSQSAPRAENNHPQNQEHQQNAKPPKQNNKPNSHPEKPEKDEKKNR
jgi:WXXGXW repeat (2 copies)